MTINIFRDRIDRAVAAANAGHAGDLSKFNPNHDSSTGEFSSGDGGGAPKANAGHEFKAYSGRGPAAHMHDTHGWHWSALGNLGSVAAQDRAHREEHGLPPKQSGKGPMKPPSVATMMKWDRDGVARATDGCRVEPDGHCQHGNPSWLLKLGMI